MRILLRAGALALMASLLTPLAAGAHADEPPTTDPSPSGPPLGQVYVESTSYSGTGCLPGSAAVGMSPDATAFAVFFDGFSAFLGPDYPLTDQRKYCQLHVQFHVPDGFTFAIASVEQHGYLDLADGALGMMKTLFYYQGQMLPAVSVWTTFQGPRAMDYHIRDEVTPAALIWSPCGMSRTVNISTQMQIRKGTSLPGTTSFVTMDGENLDQRYNLVWARCPGAR